MSSQGPSSTTGNTNGGDSVDWTSPGNIISPTVFASVALDQQGSSALRCVNVPFTIPVGSTINGIAVSFSRKSLQSGNIVDDTVALTKDGSQAAGNNQADTGTQWPIIASAATYGGAADLWGTTWTVAEVNAATFGVILRCQETGISPDTGSANSLTITVYYTAGASSASVTPGPASLTITTFAPSVSVGTVVTPGPATLNITTFAPTVTVGSGSNPSKLLMMGVG